eukprot:1196198-Alexandrium_andersonii.AAC.1
MASSPSACDLLLVLEGGSSPSGAAGAPSWGSAEGTGDGGAAPELPAAGSKCFTPAGASGPSESLGR